MHRLLTTLLAPLVQQITGATLTPDGTVTMPDGQQSNAALRAQIEQLQADLSHANQLLLITQEQVGTQGQMLTSQQSGAAVLGGRLTTLQQLADSYTTQLAASLADRQALHQTAAANAALDAQQQAAIAALANRFRSTRVALPAMPLSAPATLAVPWPTPFADAAYTVAGWVQGAGLLKIRCTQTAQTAAGVTVTLENLGLANLLAGAGTLHLLALHD